MRDLNQVLTLKAFTGEGVSVEAPEDPREPKQPGRGEETCGRHSTHARRARRGAGGGGAYWGFHLIYILFCMEGKRPVSTTGK